MAKAHQRESDREKFVRLANARTTRAIRTIRLIGNLANKSNYEYSVEDAKKILDVLERELRNLKVKFQSSKSNDDTLFHL